MGVPPAAAAAAVPPAGAAAPGGAVPPAAPPPGGVGGPPPAGPGHGVPMIVLSGPWTEGQLLAAARYLSWLLTMNFGRGGGGGTNLTGVWAALMRADPLESGRASGVVGILRRRKASEGVVRFSFLLRDYRELLAAAAAVATTAAAVDATTTAATTATASTAAAAAAVAAVNWYACTGSLHFFGCHVFASFE